MQSVSLSLSVFLCFSRSIGALGALVRRISFPTLLFSVRIIAPMPRQTKRKGRQRESFPRIRKAGHARSLRSQDFLARLAEPKELLYMVDPFSCMPSTITSCSQKLLYFLSLTSSSGKSGTNSRDVLESLPFHCRANVSITLSTTFRSIRSATFRFKGA